MRPRRWQILLVVFLVITAGVAFIRFWHEAKRIGRGASPGSFFRQDEADQSIRVDPLTGLPPLQDAEYFAAVIENAPAARPQRGLGAASIVYEMLAEGGITRFLAFYSGRSSVEIGPIRSVRPYIVDIASGHGTVLAHCGGSQEALAIIAESNYPSVNELVQGSAFYRDNTRRVPHNLYAKAESILDCARRMGYRTDFAESGYVFRKREARGNSNPIEVTIRYSPGYSVQWEYDAKTSLWLRSINKKPHVDANTGQQIAAANVIIEVVPTRVLDDEGRLSMELVGSGEVVALSAEEVMCGRWVRLSGTTDPAVYVAETGTPIELCPGNTWVQIVSEANMVEINSGQGELGGG